MIAGSDIFNENFFTYKWSYNTSRVLRNKNLGSVVLIQKDEFR